MTGPKRTLRPWPVRILRRVLRVLFWGVLVLAALLLLAWLLRKELLEPLLRPQLEAVLADALGAERVTIDALDGDWVRTIDVRDVFVDGGQSPLRQLRGVRVQAAYSLAALLRGDFSGLRTATVTADLVVLDLRLSGAGAEPTAPAAGPLDLTPYEPLLSLCRDGARVRVDQLRLVLPDGVQEGPLEVDLKADAGDREVTVSYAALRLAVQVRRAVPEGGERLTATVDVGDPGAVLDLFGAGVGVREGHLHAEVSVSPVPLRLAARVDLRDLVHQGRRLAKSRIVGSLDRERIDIDTATIDLPGVGAELRALTLPSPFAGKPSLEALAGRFVVRVDDLAPHQALLPAELQALLPIQGRLAGSFAAGLLRLEECELHTRGADLQIAEGSFPFATGNWRAAVGSLRFALALHEFAADVPSVGTAQLSGRIDGTLAGSLADPKLDVHLDLGACRIPQVWFGSAAGHARADAHELAVDGLQVRGLGVEALGERAPSSLALDASCRLLADGIDADSLVAKVDLGGRLSRATFAEYLGEAVLGPAADGGWTLHLEAQHTGTGIAVANLRIATDEGAPVALAVTGEGVVPLHWSGGAGITPLEVGALGLQLTARQQATEPEQGASFAATLRLAAMSTHLDLDLQAPGALRVRGEAQTGRGVASLCAADPQFAVVPFHVALQIAELDLAQVPPAWLGGLELAGRVTGHVNAQGQPTSIAPDIVLQLADGAVRGAGWPTVDNVQLGLEVQPGATDAASKVLLRLTAALDEGLGVDRQVAFAADIESDANGTRLAPTVLQVSGGELALELHSDLRRSDLLGGTVSGDRATLAGTVALREFALERLPATWLGVGALRGIATGEAEIGGSIAAGFRPALLQSAKFVLRDGELKAANLPRLERLAAELRYAPQQLDLVSASGTIGAGEFTAHGTMQHDDLLASFDAAKVDLRLAGKDLLLYRGDGAKVRATADLVIAGTPHDLQASGKIVLGRGSKFVRRISILPDLNSKGGETVNEGLRLVELPPEIGERLAFDVAITTSEPFEVRTNVFDGQVDVAAALRGKGTAPRIEGTMSLRSGLLRFPGANLRVTSGLLTFTRSDPLFPRLTVQAEGKRLGFLVTMSVTGRYDAPTVQLSSVPALPPQDLIVLLTTGQLPSTLVARGAEGQARFVGGYLAQEVLDAWFGSDSTERGESLLDRLTIEAGREVSKNGTESLLVEYELGPHVAVQVERDAYEDYNLGLVLRFRFR